MENRLCLNKRPVYELPEEIKIRVCWSKNQKNNFEPNICISAWGNVGRIENFRASAKQIWIKTNNKDLINFIIKYDWGKEASKMTTPTLSIWQFKKIILEEFYGVKNGE